MVVVVFPATPPPHSGTYCNLYLLFHLKRLGQRMSILPTEIVVLGLCANVLSIHGFCIINFLLSSKTVMSLA